MIHTQHMYTEVTHSTHTTHTSTCMQSTHTNRLFLACAIFPSIFPTSPNHTHMYTYMYMTTPQTHISDRGLTSFPSSLPNTLLCPPNQATSPNTLGLMTHQLPALMLMAVTKAMLRCSVHTLGAGLRKNGSMNISPG